MNRKFKLVAAFALSALCVASAFAYPGARYREYPTRQRPVVVRGERAQAARTMPVQPTPVQPRPALPAARRFALPPGGGYERNGKIYPHPYQGAQSAPVLRNRTDRMSPEQRSALRRQINEANRDLRYQRR